jgi:hypothetical protein
MMHLFQLPLFQNQTLLTQPELDRKPDEKKKNSTEDHPRYLIQILLDHSE